MSKVTTKMLIEENEIYDEFIEIPVMYEAKEYIIKAYPYVSPVKLTNIVDQLSAFYQNANQEKVNVLEEEKSDLLAYFLVKNSTDVTFTKSKKAKTVYQEFKQLLHSRVFKAIVKTFPEQTFRELHERIAEVNNLSGLLEAYVNAAKKVNEEFDGEGVKKLKEAKKNRK
ncbi:hypothetical protein [Cytobacillus oceanisediminis]|uniref:hypothetical protein n=2 Tax=Cytobacillus TaxID=2675230 RepID=UPI00203ED55E|nr:hypothetical protein [Cytobacillus oceanisediminis]MCM3394842.1 hypothetical protein [Cytobacillus oceanisediminis]